VGDKHTAFAREYLGLSEEEPLNWAVLRAGMRSVAELFVAQMQDYLELGSEGRMNEPGTELGNWRWRLQKDEFSPELMRRLRRCAEIYGRL